MTDTLGVPVPNGNYQLTFRLYNQETGGTPFWSEAQTVMVENELFSVLLGAVTPIPSVPDAGVLYLSLQVGTGSELTPRLRIVSSPYAYLAERSDSAGGAQRVGGYNLTRLDSRYVNEGQADAVSSAMIQGNTIAAVDLSQMGAGTGQVLKWNGAAWAPANDLVGGGDSAWVRGTPDSALYTIRQLGIARGGAGNMLYGNYPYTHINLGVACTTGTSGQNYQYCTVAGGLNNTASNWYATVAGGAADTSAGSSSFTAGDHSVVPSSYVQVMRKQKKLLENKRR